MLKCCKGFEVKPMKSAAGYYMGTTDGEGFPQCRLTTTYAKTAEEAQRLLLDRQTADENVFCHRHATCGIHEVE